MLITEYLLSRTREHLTATDKFLRFNNYGLLGIRNANWIFL